MRQKVPHVGIVASDEIIQAQDLPALIEHQVAEM
jgi:hypothetical protein